MTNTQVTLISLAIALLAGGIVGGIFIGAGYGLNISFFASESFTVAMILFASALLSVLVYQSVHIGFMGTGVKESPTLNDVTSSHELFTELYRKSPVPYIVIGNEMQIESVNFAGLRLFGVQEGWFAGKRILDLMTGIDETKRALMPEYFRTRQAIHNEDVEVIRHDGTTRWVMFSLFSFPNGKRKNKGLVTLVDITKQKEIDKAKTEFVSLASHQLRTPISAMKWNLELLRGLGKDHFTEGEITYLNTIGNNMNRMDAIITDFLSVSKLELGTLVPRTEVLLFGPLLKTILESHEKQALVRGIIIEHNDMGNNTVRADTHLLSMALDNLISNAIKYTRDSGVIRIRAHAESGHMIIAVSDNGIGIPLEEQDRVFTKIFRAQNAQRDVPDGTGLGLYIVAETIKVMGGTVSFVSEENKGTTFTIVLPA